MEMYSIKICVEKQIMQSSFFWVIKTILHYKTKNVY